MQYVCTVGSAQRAPGYLLLNRSHPSLHIKGCGASDFGRYGSRRHVLEKRFHPAVHFRDETNACAMQTWSSPGAHRLERRRLRAREARASEQPRPWSAWVRVDPSEWSGGAQGALSQQSPAPGLQRATLRALSFLERKVDMTGKRTRWTNHGGRTSKMRCTRMGSEGSTWSRSVCELGLGSRVRVRVFEGRSGARVVYLAHDVLDG